MTVDELIVRLHDHDWASQEWQTLVIAAELAKAGRVRSVGRRCSSADRPAAQWTQIPAHTWSDLNFKMRQRGQPHPGDVFCVMTGRRAWAAVQFSSSDLEREWLAAVLAEPRREAPADVVVMPPLTEAPPAAEAPPTLAEALEAYQREDVGEDGSQRGFGRWLRARQLRGAAFTSKRQRRVWEAAGLPRHRNDPRPK